MDVSCVEFLVLDEVDSLLQLGFEGQVLGVEERLPAVRQKMFFSASLLASRKWPLTCSRILSVY